MYLWLMEILYFVNCEESKYIRWKNLTFNNMLAEKNINKHWKKAKLEK